MKLYCSNCGHPISYTSQTPIFCINCGTNFNTGEAPQQITNSNVNEEKLEDLVEIEGYGKPQGMTLGQVIDNAANSREEISKPPTQKGARKRLSKKAQQQMEKEVMEEFRREAGSTRRDRPDS